MSRTDDEIRELIAAAAPGHWTADSSEVYGAGYDDEGQRDWVGETYVIGNEQMMEGNSAFIAAARELVPALLARAQAAEREAELPDGCACCTRWRLRAQHAERELDTALARAQAAEAERDALRAVVATYPKNEPPSAEAGQS